MKRTVMTMLVLAMAGGIFLCGGCFTAISEGYGAYKGGEGIFKENLIVPEGDKPLSGYTNFEIGTLDNDTGSSLPDEAKFLASLQDTYPEALLERGVPSVPGGKTAVISGRIIHYELAGMAKGLILGEVEEVVTRVKMTDKSSGKVLLEATCIGRTSKRLNRGAITKGEGLARAFVEWIKEYMPESELIKKEED